VQQLKKIPALERRSCDLPRGRRGAAAGAPAAHTRLVPWDRPWLAGY
jgi:hypothetical protein